MNAARIKDHHHHHYWQQQQQQQIFTGWLRQPVDWAGWLKSTVNKVVLRRRLPFSFLSMLQWLPRPWSLTSHFRRLCTALQFAGKHFCLIQFFCVFFAFYFLNAVNGHLKLHRLHCRIFYCRKRRWRICLPPNWTSLAHMSAKIYYRANYNIETIANSGNCCCCSCSCSSLRLGSLLYKHSFQND